MSLFVSEPERPEIQQRDIYSTVIKPFTDYIDRRGVQAVTAGWQWLLHGALQAFPTWCCRHCQCVFYLDLGFTKTEIGIWSPKSQVFGCSIFGAMLGGAIMLDISVKKR